MFSLSSKDIFITKLNGSSCKGLFQLVKMNTMWDESMKSRKTASYGVPYNYNNLTYIALEFPSYIRNIVFELEKVIEYTPNNCLINYYYKNESSMGYHSDNIEILEQGTGITIISLGQQRIMRFRNIKTKQIFDVILNCCDIVHMSQEFQTRWQHSILSIKNDESINQRISLTFRKIKLST